MFKHILVPLDCSKVGEAALPVIDQLCENLGPGIKVEITLLGIMTILRHWVVVGEASAPVSYTEDELNLIKQRVMNYLDKTTQSVECKGVTINTMVRMGNAAEEIHRVAEEIHADLIAMSTHGRSGLRRLAFGSITDKVLRETRIPVLMVRAPKGTVNE